MIIITKIIKIITEYEKLGKANIFPIQYNCSNCGYMGRLHRHGFYCRNVITKFSIHQIYILRIKCPSCNKTYSLIPSFLIPYYQYSFEFIFSCLYLVYIAKDSYSKIIKCFKESNPKIYFNVSNIYSFKKRMKESSQIINSFFVNYEKYYYKMDSASETLVLEKIKDFIDNEGNFNYTYFTKMPKYFFAKP